jgi:tetratricopeptide (TPR) repeat protein
MNVWVAKGAALPPGYRPRRLASPLVGREAELSMLENAVSLSIRNQRSQVLLLLGEAGVGKTRLASEIAPMVREQWPNAAVLNGRCVPYGEANPWWPIADALRHGVGVGLDEPLDAARTATTESVAHVLGDDPRTPSVVNGLLHLMGYEGPLRGLDPTRARAEATQALLTYMEAWVRERPVVVRLADLHWADDLVLELIDELSTQLARAPFVFVATARRSLLRRWSPRAGRHNGVVLNVDPLDRRAASQLVDAVAPVELPGHVREMLLDRAGGNPLYLEELITLVGDGRGVSAVSDLELPDTLRGLIAARIDSLTTDEQHTLEDAAVWGESGHIEALERLAQGTRGVPDGVEQTVAMLELKEIITFDGTHWAFRSDLVREVAYARLTKADRLRRHKGIANYLETASGGRFVDDGFVDTVARHYGEAARLAAELGPLAEAPEDLTERARRWVGEAARRAEQGAAWILAERLHDQALALSGDDVDAQHAEDLAHLLGRARARNELWRFDDARDDAALAVSLARRLDDREAKARALSILGEVEARSGAIDEAQRLLDMAIVEYDQLGDVHGRAEARRLSGMAALFAHDYEGAREPVADALEDFRAADDARGVAWALQNLAWISFVRGQIDDAETRLIEAGAVFAELGDHGGQAWTDGLMAFVRFYQGRVPDARELATKVLRESERRADRWGQGMMLLVLGAIDLWEGRTVRAEEYSQRSVGLLRSLGDTMGLEQSLALRSRALLMLGRVAEGNAAIAEASSLRHAEHFAEHVRLTSEVVLGDPTSYRELDELARQLSSDEFDGFNVIESRVVVALGLAQASQLERASEIVAEARALDPSSSFANAVAALIAAASGEADVVELEVGRLSDNPRSTYLDRVYGQIAMGLVSPEPGPIFDQLRSLLGSTGDELAKATVLLAEASALVSVGDPNATAVEAEADRRWSEMAVDPVGWRALFANATDRSSGRA